MSKLIDNQKMDSILLLREKGISYKQVCDILSTSEATVARVIKADEAARQHDMTELRTICKDRAHLFTWACKRYGIKEQEPKSEPEPKPDNTAKAFTALVESIRDLTAAVNAIDKRLSAMQLTQQGFRADMQQQITKVIEAVNVNGDIATKEHEKANDLLAGIKSNTKRGPAL